MAMGKPNAPLDILARITGDKRPEAGAAIRELTRSYMAKFNQEVADVPGVYYQSYGTTMQGPSDDPVFAVTYSLLLHEHEGENDGMVSTTSCQWGNFRGLITTNDPKRGISHADMVDYRKTLVSWIDIPRRYVAMVEDLKNRGF